MTLKRSQFAGKTAAAIAASVEQAIQGGSLAAGATLPTIRQLAAALRVSPVTVAAAYRLLGARGLVAGDGRRGTVVRRLPGPGAVSAPLVADGVVDLASGNPDPLLLPPFDGALRDLDPSPRLYGDPPHLRPLVAFAASEFEADGIPARAIAVTSGALDAIDRLLVEHLRPGDRVAVEDPTLPALLDMIAGRGWQPEPMAIDGEGVQSDSLQQALRARSRAVLLTPRAQNPTGAAVSGARASDLRRVLRQHRDVLLVENDACGDVSGAPEMTLCDGAHPLWAVVRSTSKSLGPDLRVAVVAGDELTIARVHRRQAIGPRWVSHLLQQLVLALWSDPSAGRRLARAAEIYAQRRGALVEALHAAGMEGVQCRSGFNVWIPVAAETATVQALAGRGWAVAPGERFRLRSAPGIRVTTSALAPEDAQRFARDLAEVRRPTRSAFA